jgi:hypothetical protein
VIKNQRNEPYNAISPCFCCKVKKKTALAGNRTSRSFRIRY